MIAVPALAAAAAVAATLSVGAADRPLVAAEVGDRTITLGDLADELAALSPAALDRYRDKGARVALLDDAVRLGLLAVEAEKRGLAKDAGVARARKQAAIAALIVKLDPAARTKLLAEVDARLEPVVLHADALAALKFDSAGAGAGAGAGGTGVGTGAGAAAGGAGAPRPPGPHAGDVAAEGAAGKAKVLVGELQARLDELPPVKAESYRSPKGRERLAREALAFELLAADALAAGLGDDPRVVRATRAELAAALLRTEVPPLAPAAVVEKDARAWYVAHEDEFTVPELRRAAHLIVADEAGARALAESLRGADASAWAEAARARGTPGAGLGDLGFFTRDGRGWSPASGTAPTPGSGAGAGLLPAAPIPSAPVAPAEVIALAWTLDGAGATGVAHTAAGWHVVRLVAHRPALHRPFEEVADRCRAGAAAAARTAKIDALLARARKAAPVKLHPETLDRLVIR